VSLSAAAAITIALLAWNAFFVIAEFALVTARRPRLERAAARGSRAARAAAAELPLALAGAQLGVTICSLGLVSTRVLQRILALTAAIWHNDATSQPVMRSLLAYDH